jgi:hypothetical protein
MSTVSLVPSSTASEINSVHLSLHQDRTEGNGELTGIGETMLKTLFLSASSSMSMLWPNLQHHFQKDEGFEKLGQVFEVWFQAQLQFESESKSLRVKNEGKEDALHFGPTRWTWDDWARINALVQLVEYWADEQSKDCVDCKQSPAAGMGIKRHLQHAIPCEPLPRTQWTHLKGLVSTLDLRIVKLMKLRNWMRESGLSLRVSPNSPNTFRLELELKAIRRAIPNESLAGRDDVIEATGQAFVLANDMSLFDVSTVTGTTDSETLPEAESHNEINLETLQRSLHLHRMDNALDSQHIKSYYNQLQEWEPPQGSFASLVQTDVLQALAIEMSAIHPPHDSHSRSLLESRVTSELAFGPLSDGP